MEVIFRALVTFYTCILAALLRFEDLRRRLYYYT